MASTDPFEEFRRKREIERLEKKEKRKKKEAQKPPTTDGKLPFNDSNSWIY